MRYALILLFLCGCSYTYPIGTIGNKKLTKVNLGSLFGPGQTMIAVEDTNTHEVTFMAPIGGNGILPSAVVAGALVGGAALISRGDYGDTVSVNNSGGSPVVNSAPVINIPDPPPAPPLPAPSGIGPPFGSKQNFPRNWSK